MKIVTVTDAWEPQVNGVVRTIQATNRELESAGHQVALITPREYFTIPCPAYADIRLALFAGRGVRMRLKRELVCDEQVAIHIATEGPLGRAAARFCRRYGIPFTTAYHTRFPQYLKAMYRIPERWTYASLRRFHAPAERVLAATATVERELADAGILRVARWERAVDTELFRPMQTPPFDVPRPMFLYVGRVSVEKNIEAFLSLDLPGTKVVGGDGPALKTLKLRFPEVVFTGVVTGEKLAQLYSMADAFVFPSRTDTFGLVMLEALACGTPVAAFPVQGPLDVVGDGGVAVLDHDLRRAATRALKIDRARCREFALRHSWRAASRRFLELQCPVGGWKLRAGEVSRTASDASAFAHRLPFEPLA